MTTNCPCKDDGLWTQLISAFAWLRGIQADEMLLELLRAPVLVVQFETYLLSLAPQGLRAGTW